MRYSKQRDIVQSVVCSTDCHPTADWVFAEVKKSIPNISLGTVYRNLKQLSDSGFINRIQDGSVTRYDGNIKSHYHLKCNRCNKITDISLEKIDLRKIIKTKFDFELSDVELTITGKCNKHT